MVDSAELKDAGLPLLDTKLYIPRRRPALVPRPRLMERLDRGARGKLTFVSAPAGFGKSTLLAEWAEAMAARGRTATWISLDHGDNAPALFWSYVITALRTVLPEIGESALAMLRSPQPPPMEWVLTGLINDVNASVADVSVILDDYHLIEAEAIHSAMAFLLDHLPPRMHLVLVTRSDPPLPLPRLRARGDLTELRAADLRFTPDEAAAFLNEAMGLDLTAADVASLETRTEGWIAGLQLAALSMQGREDVRGFIQTFAGDDRYIVDYLVEEVLERQPEHIRSFLLQTSILDRLSGPLCDAVTGRAGARGLLEEALAARVIEELPRAMGRYQFTHALIQETLLSELSLTRRTRLHARIAPELEKLYGSQAVAHAAELAHHYGQAEAIAGPEKVVQYTLLAGERALAAYAWEEALAHFQRGLAARGILLESAGPAPDAELAALLFGLGRARAATAERGQLQQVVDILDRAFDFYERAGDVPHALAVAEYPMPTTTLGRSGVSQYITRALQLTGPDSPAAGRLLSSYGLELARLDNNYQGAREAFARALAIARRERDISLEVRTLSASANVDLFHLHTAEGLDQARQALQLAQRLDEPRATWSAHLDLARALPILGAVEEAQQHALAILGLAEQLRDRYRLALAYRLDLIPNRLLGRFAQARESGDRGLAAAPEDCPLMFESALLEYEVGDFDRGEVYVERLLNSMPSMPRVPGGLHACPALIIPFAARMTGGLDRLDVAARAAETLVSSSLTNPLFALAGRGSLGLLAVLRSNVELAREQYGFLESQRGTMLWPAGFFSADRLLGLLSHTLGYLDQATGHFEDALAFCRNAGYRPELAWTCCDYADTLLARNDTEDRQRAMSLLYECLTISRELGMRPLMERALSRREILKA